MTENESRQKLVGYRLDQAGEALVAARTLLLAELFRDSVNRAYYAMFYAVLALLATRNLGTSKHSGAIELFDREFVKSGVFPKEYSKWLHTAFDLRLQGDYRELTLVTKKVAEEMVRTAEVFIEQVRHNLELLAVAGPGDPSSS